MKWMGRFTFKAAVVGAGVATALSGIPLASVLTGGIREAAAAAPPRTTAADVLLIGGGPSDPTTSAWQSALTAEGVAYTLVNAPQAYGSKRVTLPPLITGGVGNFDAVVVADSPGAFTQGAFGSSLVKQLGPYEMTFGVRQLDGYSAPSELLGLGTVSAGESLNGWSAALTPAGSAALPGVGGVVSFATGTYGYPARATTSAFTPWLVDGSGDVLAGVYQHQPFLPGVERPDLQSGVSEAVLLFDYNASFSQWLQLAPGLIDWVTQSTPTAGVASQGNLAPPSVGMAAMPRGNGYWLVNSAGEVSPHGAAVNYGSLAGIPLNAPITHIVATTDGRGYWLVGADGGVFSFGDASFYGSMGGQHLNAPVVSLAPTADSRGYWLVAADGGIFAFGDAQFQGSMGGLPLNKPVVGIAPDVATGGYWLVATDGGIFNFDAPFLGSTGDLTLDQPVNGMAPGPGDAGYWLVASDGGIFSFGDAAFYGSMGGTALNAPIVGMAVDNVTYGYWLLGSDGGIFSFGAPFFGSD